jgi:hypothetical protein
VTAPVGCSDLLVERHDKNDGFTFAGPEPTDSYDRMALDKADRVACGSARSVAVYAADTDPGCPIS